MRKSNKDKIKYKDGVDIETIRPEYRYLYEDFSDLDAAEVRKEVEKEKRNRIAPDENRGFWFLVAIVAALGLAMFGLSKCGDGNRHKTSYDDINVYRK